METKQAVSVPLAAYPETFAEYPPAKGAPRFASIHEAGSIPSFDVLTIYIIMFPAKMSPHFLFFWCGICPLF